MKKLLTTMAFTGAFIVSAAPSAFGQGYGGADGTKVTTTVAAVPTAPKLEEVNSTLPPLPARGRTVEVSIGGFAPNSTVDVFIRSEPVYLGRFQSDANGVVKIAVTIPDDVPAGDHNIVAAGTDPSGNPFSVAAAVAVGPTATRLALTGSNSGNLVALAGLLIAVGSVGTIAARRRMTIADSSSASIHS